MPPPTAGTAESRLWDLAVRYAMATDDRDWTTLVSLFTADAQLVARAAPGTGRADQTLAGPEQIGGVAELLAPYERTFHLLGQSRYQVDGDQVTGIVYCQAHHFWTDEAGGHDLVMYIRYHDRYREVGDGWRFASRELVVDWTERRRRSDR